MHKDAHNLTLRRRISEVNSPTIRSDDRRARVLQGRPIRRPAPRVYQARLQALWTGIGPRLEAIQPSEFLRRREASLAAAKVSPKRLRASLRYGNPRDSA
jgi:hypothetical protein